jgi:hypothetical protein
MKAAKANNLPFYPINPAHEEVSWELFHKEVANKFRNSNYTADYEAKLINEFNMLLPEVPSWEKR